MNIVKETMAQQVAVAASALQQQRTGHKPQSVTVVLSGDTLVVTLHEALTLAEKALAKTSAGAAQVREFHRALFTTSCESMRHQIKQITGVDVREATAEIETTTGAIVQVFTTGTVVQVFLLAEDISEERWNAPVPEDRS
jgi:uncharacterized protein YbcI